MIIAIPDNPIYNPLTINAAPVLAKLGWQLIRTTEKQCASLLQDNRVNVALLTPLGYAMGVGIADYRIIPSPLIVLNNYTGIAGIVVKTEVESLSMMHSANPDDFLVKMGEILIAERFDIPTKILHAEGSNAEIAARHGVAVGWTDATEATTFDVSEEWMDLVELPLPICSWVHRNEYPGTDFATLVKSFANGLVITSDLPVTEVLPAESGRESRLGSISWEWTDEVEESYFGILQMLFFHQIIAEIPAIKLDGRD